MSTTLDYIKSLVSAAVSSYIFGLVTSEPDRLIISKMEAFILLKAIVVVCCVYGTTGTSCVKDGIAGTWKFDTETCVCQPTCKSSQNLVSGSDGVKDNQLNQSSTYCDVYSGSIAECRTNPLYTSAIYSRLNSTGWLTGSWQVGKNDTNQYIEVDFQTDRVVTGIVLKARAKHSKAAQYVTRFQLQQSKDCVQYSYITDASGEPATFEGNDGKVLEDEVTRNLPQATVARCIRLRPTVWVSWISLRWDVLGCKPGM